MYYRQLGTLITIPRGHGDKVRSSRWQTPIKITKGSATLTGTKGIAITAVKLHLESTVITPGALCATNITGQITGWAGARGYTDKTIIMSMANFIEGALESLTRELAFRLDAYVRTKVSASALYMAAVTPAGAKPTSSNKVPSTNVLNSKNLARIAPFMRANGLPPWDDGAFVGITHDLSVYDIFADSSATGYVTIARYNDARRIYRGEIGEFYGVRLLLNNTNRILGALANTVTLGISVNASGTNLYVFAPDSFYNLELESGGVEVWHQPLGSAGADDPVGQYGSIGVKVYYGVMPAPTEDQRILRMAHGLGLANTYT